MNTANTPRPASRAALTRGNSKPAATRLPTHIHLMAQAAAELDGITLSEWLRGLVVDRLEVTVAGALASERRRAG